MPAPVPPNSIDALPAVPSPADPANFEVKADAYLGAFPAFRAQANAAAQNVYDNSVIAYNSASAAAASETTAGNWATSTSIVSGSLYGARKYANDASASASAAAASALSAVNAPGAAGTSTNSDTIALGSTTITTQPGKAWVVGQWVVVSSSASPANQMIGYITAYNGTTGSITIFVTQVLGSGTFSSWNIALNGPQGPNGTASMTVQSQSTALALTQADANKLIHCTGSWNLTFPAANSLILPWSIRVANVGTGVITVVRSSTNTIDDLTSYPIYPGEVRDFSVATSSSYVSVIVNPFHAQFIASGSFIAPPGYSCFMADGIGGGGGGGGGGWTSGPTVGAAFSGAGGAGAQRRQAWFSMTAGTAYAVTIGAGGAGGSATVNGGDGENTTLGSLGTWFGGKGGNRGAVATTGPGGSGMFGMGGADGSRNQTVNIATAYAGDGWGVTGGVGGVSSGGRAGSAEWGGAGGGTGGGASGGGQSTNSVGGSSLYGGAGGGGGGVGYYTGNFFGRDGYAGGAAGSYTNGGGGAGGAMGAAAVAGSSGADGNLLQNRAGGGGGGGGGSNTTGGIGAAGANGGACGGGGGGGGGSGDGRSGSTVTAGGAGGRGELVLWGVV